MSLFQWSTPERRSGDRDLCIIPNEIYLTIFEHIAPPSARLSPQQLKMFTNLCLVCRFFGNLCLPRVFGHVKFYEYDRDTCGVVSLGRTLCQHIAAKEPLALALAQCVKCCYLTNSPLAYDGWPELRTLSRINLTGMAHMKNIRELKITASNVKMAHWDVIATLESLQKLCFEHCFFWDNPADLYPDKKVKVPCLDVSWCEGACSLYAAVDARHLRTLIMDMTDIDFGHEIEWLSETAITELRIYPHNEPTMSHIRVLQDILHHTSHSLQVLTLPIYPFSERSQVLFEDPAWRNMPHLRSLTLQVWCGDISPMAVIRWICYAVRVHRGLQSFSIQDATSGPLRLLLSRGPLPLALSRAEIRQIVHEELNCIPGLNFVEIGGTSVRLVDGKWMDAESKAM
ncbi:hypothetical protein BU15DRAFT_80519 [Melanogaster broomeanus]|nr:hypothetical protein BU15DRAFT_80519 [Melanogaster broomeanus]